MTRYKGYKVRLFPTEEQEEMLWKHIHACRFIWNFFLGEQNLRYEMRKRGKELYGDKYKPSECEKHLGKYEMINILTKLKQQKEYLWLSEVARHSLMWVLNDLDRAFKMYFNHICNRLKFKGKRKSKPSFPLREEPEATYFYNENYLKVPKIGRIKCKIRYDLKIQYGAGKTKLINPRISYEVVSGKWMLSFELEVDDNQVHRQKLTDKSMGIDMGINKFAVVAFGNEIIIYDNANTFKRMVVLTEKEKHIHRIISRKYAVHGNYEKTKNIIKYENILRTIRRKKRNIRTNYIHQVTRQLVNMLPEKVVMEDLDVINMDGNTGDIPIYTFKVFMKYKCEWEGINFVIADRYFPSSQKCSKCGSIYKKVKKRMLQEWKCPICNTIHYDRDINAAINLMNYNKN